MKSLINKNDSLTEYPIVKLDTETLISKYVDKFGLGYVIRNYKISPSFFKEIADEKYSNTSDEIYTESEIILFQSFLAL